MLSLACAGLIVVGCQEAPTEVSKAPEAAQAPKVVQEFWLAPMERFRAAPKVEVWEGDYLDLSATEHGRKRPYALPLLGIYAAHAPLPLDLHAALQHISAATGVLPAALAGAAQALQEPMPAERREALIAETAPRLEEALKPYRTAQFVRFALPTDRLFFANGVKYDTARKGFAPDTGIFDSPTVDAVSGEVRRVKMDLPAQYGATMILTNPEAFRFLSVPRIEDARIIEAALRQVDGERYRFDLYGEIRGAIFNESTISHHVAIRLRRLELVDTRAGQPLASYTLR